MAVTNIIRIKMDYDPLEFGSMNVTLVIFKYIFAQEAIVYHGEII